MLSLCKVSGTTFKLTYIYYLAVKVSPVCFLLFVSRSCAGCLSVIARWRDITKSGSPLNWITAFAERMLFYYILDGRSNKHSPRTIRGAPFNIMLINQLIDEFLNCRHVDTHSALYFFQCQNRFCHHKHQ